MGKVRENGDENFGKECGQLEVFKNSRLKGSWEVCVPWQVYEAIEGFRAATVEIPESEMSFHLQMFKII